MEQQIILRVRPDETVCFPALCVACGQPAGERLALQKRRGQVTRRLDAPLCAECARRLARRSGDEERLLRLSWPAAILVTLLSAALVAAVLPFGSWWLRLALGFALGVISGAFVRRVLVRRAEATELPERRAVRESARIVDFTWRDMTLAFTHEEMAAQVAALNPDYLPGEQPLEEQPEAGDAGAPDNE